MKRLRPRLKRSEPQWWDRDWKCLSLNDDTKSKKMWVSTTRPRPRLIRSESQWRDQDWKCPSLNNKTEIETENVWVSMTSQRPRLKKFESEWRETRLGKRCRYWDPIKTLVDIRPSTCHEMTSVWKGSSDICQIFFLLTFRANPAISSRNRLIDFDWIYLLGLDSFCLAFLGWMT